VSINITAVGAAGTHSFKKVSVNSEDNFIYFRDSDIPSNISSGQTFIYDDGTGSVDGITEGSLVYALIETEQVLRFTDSTLLPENSIDISGSVGGSFTLNDPIVFDNKLNINISTPSNQAVKYYTTGSPLTGLTPGETYFLKNVAADFTGTQALYELENDTHTFATCGQTGRLGPTSQQILAGYSTTWHGQYLSQGLYQGYQDWTVPVSGTYEFNVQGAAGYEGDGAGNTGRGAIIQGRVNLTKGEIITIAVGQTGSAPAVGNTYGGSGGGSFVVRKSSNEPLFIAGGGSSDAGSENGRDGQTTNRGGLGTSGRPGGEDGQGGPATNPTASRLSDQGRSGGGGGFSSRGEDAVFRTSTSFFATTYEQPGGGAFINGLLAEAASQNNRNGGDGGFGGGAAGNQENAQSGGGGGYSGGAGSRATNGNYVGGGGGSFITRSASNVATSDGQYQDLPTFNGENITNLNAFNSNQGTVAVTLVQAFTSGNTVHPTAQDAENGTNAIAIQPAGNSYHAFVPISLDIENDYIYFSSPHGFSSGQAISFSFSGEGTPDISEQAVYYVNRVDDFTIGLIYSPAANFTVPSTISTDDIIRTVVVNLDLDSLNIPNHGFSVDQPIQYSVGGGEPIQIAGGTLEQPLTLTDGETYYVSEVVDADNIKLKGSLTSPTSIDFIQAGTGTSHSFIFLTVNLNQNTLYIPNHGLVSGQIVLYNNNGGNSVGGLTDGEFYYVRRIDDSTIELYDDPNINTLSNRVALTSTGTGTHSLAVRSLDFESDTMIIPEHGFLQGEIVEYDSRGQAEIAGLTSNETYYVIFVDGDNIKLAETAEDAEDNIPVDLQDSPPGVGTHILTNLGKTPDGIYEILDIPTEDTFEVEARGQVSQIEKLFNPRSTVLIELDQLFIPSHGFLTGTKVTYSSGISGTDIGGLVDGQDYYVVSVNQDYFKLSEESSPGAGDGLQNALAGETVTLTNFGSGVAHSVTTNQLNGSIVGSGNVSVDAGSVLVNGVGTSFSKILKVGDSFTIYPDNQENTLIFADSNVNTANNRIEISHSFNTGDFVRFDTGGGVAPTPLINSYYYYIGVVDANSIQLYTSLAAAQAGGSNIEFSSTGTGSNFKLTNTIPSGPIVRRITAVGSDSQVTVDRPYSAGYNQAAYAYPTFVYVRPSGYSLHRPFDGGVEMSTGSGNSYAQIIRQTRKYFRYQSGKGIQTSFAINFKPSIDIEKMERFSPTTIEVKTRRPHNLVSGLSIEIAEAEDSSGEVSNLYNGIFQVTVIDLTTFRIVSNSPVPEGDEAKAYGFPQFHVRSWTNGAIRSGMFDFQNGMFFEFDGQKLYCVRRSSTQQMAGTVSALRGSELIFGDKTKFTAQLKEGDNIVMRGQTYRVIDIQDDTTLSVRPEYRGSTGLEITFDPQIQVDTTTDVIALVRHGLSQNIPVIYNSIDGEAIGGLVNGRTYYADVINANSIRLLPTPNAPTPVNLSSQGTTNLHSFVPAKSGIIVTKTVDTKVPQEEWNIDTCDGNGPSGYNLDLSRIQMCYMDYSWYGAGKIRFGFKTNDGLVRYVHEFKHNNILFESYFRSGNLPARYEVSTGLNPTYIPSLFHWGTSVIMDGTFDDDRGYLFTEGSQTLSVEGTTAKSFASNGINLETDLFTVLTHGFKTGDVVEFQSIAADGLPGLDAQNPTTEIVGNQEFATLTNNAKYKVFVNSTDLIHLTPENATITVGANFAQSGTTVTVTTAQPHGIPVSSNNVGIYNIGITALGLDNDYYVGPVTVTGPQDGTSTTFEFTADSSATVSSTASTTAAISEVLNFTSQGNVQYTYFLYPEGSLNNTTGPNFQPLISLRLSPSADSGLTGKLGDRDIINRMQVRMQEIGISTDELVEVKLILNGRLNNLGFTPVAPPSLVELVEHTPQDTISGGVQVYNFQAEGGSTTTLDIDTLFELSNSILGGDNIFPDGPDILTVCISRLTGNSTRTSAKLTWTEAQA